MMRKRGSNAKYIVPLIFIIIIAYGFATGGVSRVISMGAIWIISNAIFGAIGAALALAHPITITATAVASPITSVNPTTPAGLVAAVVEAHVRKPKVVDFENITKLKSAWDAWKNNVTRIILVFLFANWGSSIGAMVAFFFMTHPEYIEFVLNIV